MTAPLSLKHFDSPAGENHVLQNFVYADATARAAAVVVAGDVGKVAYQTDQRSYWICAAQAAGVPTWARLDDNPFAGTQPLAAMSINASTGNDTNVGSAASPLKTWAEFARRYNATNVTITVGCVLTIETTLAESLDGSFAFDGTGAFLEIVAAAPTVLLGSLVIDSVVTQDRATNTRYAITDAAVADFSIYVGKRVRRTSDNSRGWVMKGVGSTFNPSRTWAPTRAVPLPSQLTWATGNTYQIEEPSVSVVGCNLGVTAHRNGSLTTSSIYVNGLGFTDPQAFATYNFPCPSAAPGRVTLNDCHFTPGVSSEGGVSLHGCYFAGGLFPGLPGRQNIHGGGTAGGLSPYQGATMVIGSDFVVQGGAATFSGGNDVLLVSGLAIWDWTGTQGLDVQLGARVFSSNTVNSPWGSTATAASVGCKLHPSCLIATNVAPTITGPGGDVVVQPAAAATWAAARAIGLVPLNANGAVVYTL